MKKVLVLAPHTDDGELGCGGTISRFSMNDHEVMYVAFSAPLKALKKELTKAMRILGVKRTSILDFKVRKFQEHRQDILDIMIGLRDDYDPQIVFIPSVNDMHQDHAVIAQEGIRAFRQTTILAYELPWNTLKFNHQSFIKLEPLHISKKIRALECYKTQKHKLYMNPKVVRGLASARGMQIGVKYAECFEVVRWII